MRYAGIIKNDIMLDEDLSFESTDTNPFYIDGRLSDIADFKGKLVYGKMPEKDNEVILLTDKYNYYFTEKVDEAIGKTYYLFADEDSISIKITGVAYKEEENSSYYEIIYCSKYDTDDFEIQFDSSIKNEDFKGAKTESFTPSGHYYLDESGDIRGQTAFFSPDSFYILMLRRSLEEDIKKVGSLDFCFLEKILPKGKNYIRIRAYKDNNKKKEYGG